MPLRRPARFCLFACALSAWQLAAGAEPQLPRFDRAWTVYLLPHSHVDIGYTHLQPEVEKMQWRNLELGIEMARKTAEYPEGARFKWNVEVLWAVESYLRQAAPEKRREFLDAVKAGWIGLDALYGNLLTGLCRPEELVRATAVAQRLERQTGVRIDSAMISDVPGYTWGLVPALQHAGVKYFSAGPNYSDRLGRTLSEHGDRPFWWVGPSGKDRVLCWVAGQGYSLYHRHARDSVPAMLRYLERLEKSGYPYAMVHVRNCWGGDNGPPDPTLADTVRDWNAAHDNPRLVIATTSAMFREFERRWGDKLPQRSGDFTPYWEDGAVSSARETAINRTTSERLVQAETLWTMLRPRHFPAADFDVAWRNVLLYNEHTWGAHNSISQPDAPFVVEQWKIKQAFALDADAQSRKLLAGALDQRGAPVGSAVDVFNTLSWARTDLLVLPRELTAAGDLVTDADGNAVPSQRLATGELAVLVRDLPPLAGRRYRIGPGKAAGGAARAEGNSIETATLSLKIDEQTGAIASLRAKGLDADLADTRAGVGLNSYFYLPGADLAKLQSNGPVTLRVKDAGPLVAALTIESDAPGCNRLVREVRVVDGLDRVDIVDLIDKKPVRAKEGVHLGFAFHVPGGVMRLDVPWAVFRPEVDQLPGACRNWLCVGRWADVSNEQYGVTWATLDAPLVQVGATTANLIGSQSDPKGWLARLEPSQTLYVWAMNNHWHTNYRAEQEGPTVFRFAVRPHRGYLPDEAARFGIGLSQPPVAAAAAGAMPGKPRLRIEPAGVLLTALLPSSDGRGSAFRLFNATGKPCRATVVCDPEVYTRVELIAGSASSSGPAGASSTTVCLDMPAWGLALMRAEP